VAPVEHFGAGLRAVTGASLGLYFGTKREGFSDGEPGGTRYVVTTSKAAGVRSAFVRQHLAMNSPSFCGPLTFTFHVQGRIMLPPGINTSGLPFELPHGRPCIIVTAACGNAIEDPLDVLQPQTWPHGWEVLHSVPHGLWIAAPRFRTWSSAAVHHMLAADVHAAPSGAEKSRLAEELAKLSAAPEKDQDTGPHVKYFAAPQSPLPIAQTVTPPKVKGRRVPAPTPTPAAIAEALRAGNGDTLVAALLRIADAPGSATSSTAYKGLFAAALAGLTGRFVSAEENALQWHIWGRTIEIADRAGAAPDASIPQDRAVPGSRHAPPSFVLPRITSHPVGDRSWFFSLPPPSESLSLCNSPGASAGFLPNASSPAPEDVVVVATDRERLTVSQFASDFVHCMWQDTLERPFLHLAMDSGPELVPFYERLVASDSRNLAPWQVAFLWPARERDMAPDSPNSTVSFIFERILLRTALAQRRNSLMSPFNPNVTHPNILASRVLRDNALDLVVLLFPAREQGAGLADLRAAVQAAAAGRPSSLESAEHMRRYGAFGALGDRDGDLFASSGKGMQLALRHREIAKRNPSFKWPHNPKPNAEAIKRRPQGLSEEEADPFFKMPPPPLFFNGTVDVRLARPALHVARAVFVVVPRSSIALYREEAANATATLSVGVAGEALEADALLPQNLPLAFLEDLGLLVGGRRSVRLYVTDF
jgi:hypothetical protein